MKTQLMETSKAFDVNNVRGKVNSIGIGLIGAGNIANSHVDAIKQMHGRAHIVAVYDISSEKTQSILKERNIEAVIASDVEEIFSNPAIELVDICLPNNLHAETCIMALNAGKNVICEKPLACSLYEVDQIIKTQKETGMKAFSIFQNRYGQGFQTLLKLIEDGVTGKILSGKCEVNWYRPDEYYANEWRGTWSGECGGCVLTCGIHAIDIFLEIMGNPISIFAQAAHRMHEIETEDIAQILGRFGNNDSMGVLQVTTNSREESTCLKFVFENMTVISSTQPYTFANMPWRFIGTDREKQEELECIVEDIQANAKINEGTQNQNELFHLRQIEDIVRFLRYGGEPAHVTAESTRKVFEFISRMYKSINIGELIIEDIQPDSPFYVRMYGTTDLLN